MKTIRSGLNIPGDNTARPVRRAGSGFRPPTQPTAGQRSGRAAEQVDLDEFETWLNRGSLTVDPQAPEAATADDIEQIRSRAGCVRTVDSDIVGYTTGVLAPGAMPPVLVDSGPDDRGYGDTAAEVWALVERAQAGEAQAFGLIYDRYVDTVFRFVYFRVGDRRLAEDLTSDTFLRALQRIGSFTWQGRDLGAWLVTIARNLVADHVESGRHRLETTTGDVREPHDVALLTAVRQLDPQQQECIVLRFLQGFSVAETAQAMGTNEGAVKALQYRAVHALNRLLPDGFSG
ncbi:hypothetical protein Q0Z83_037640 [Actinoplanes sichuanensis]|uniref:Sigma-70 family RNA polymerase sigma factor n=1 Tax=Actinoplanes sichuanensis TaxID=512349 RepID=A0ABW4A3D4_9ACTN|nr:hypothetical protein Q0Z83_037640 [Actinoplanes sichuanensis]